MGQWGVASCGAAVMWVEVGHPLSLSAPSPPSLGRMVSRVLFLISSFAAVSWGGAVCGGEVGWVVVGWVRRRQVRVGVGRGGQWGVVSCGAAVKWGEVERTLSFFPPHRHLWLDVQGYLTSNKTPPPRTLPSGLCPGS